MNVPIITCQAFVQMCNGATYVTKAEKKFHMLDTMSWNQIILENARRTLVQHSYSLILAYKIESAPAPNQTQSIQPLPTHSATLLRTMRHHDKSFIDMVARQLRQGLFHSRSLHLKRLELRWIKLIRRFQC
jgi:hypothetical protein